MSIIRRTTTLLGLMLLINVASYSVGSKAVVAAVAGAALVCALAHYGHQAVTLAWAQRIQSLEQHKTPGA
ncbi:hypothetical protein [Amycolatopsis kentuckyensis]|uniref:hypothetical protein n=1 Tax=Amycolatopsis kentuckyensis TaxID=218823 RepID=UPI000A38E97D|nr:hypothetical protein [Amycolatopsis kentuckyensis]